NIPRTPLPEEFLNQISYFGNEIGLETHIVDSEELTSELGEIIASCDRLRILNKYGHEEFFHEVRWTEDEALTTKDGIDLSTAHLSASEMAGFRIASDWNAIELIARWNK